MPLLRQAQSRIGDESDATALVDDWGPRSGRDVRV
jgi:hypothetical protein